MIKYNRKPFRTSTISGLLTVGPETALYTLIGDPVGHSLSPLIHNTAFDALSEDAVYVATRVEADALADAVHGLAALGFRGANVTIPHKLPVLEYLDEVTDTARGIGAVNAIRIDRSDRGVRLTGDNTDAAGFAGPLLSGRPSDRTRSALVLGAGGASRAVVYACLELIEVEDVAVSARREEQAAELIGGFGGGSAGLNVVRWEDRSTATHGADLIINCTPLGMHPEVDRSPLDDLSGVGPGQTVYDLVYAPTETRLLKDAAARGAGTIPGIEMLIGQAAAAFKWWIGRDMPVTAVRTALDHRMAGS